MVTMCSSPRMEQRSPVDRNEALAVPTAPVEPVLIPQAVHPPVLERVLVEAAAAAAEAAAAVAEAAAAAVAAAAAADPEDSAVQEEEVQEAAALAAAAGEARLLLAPVHQALQARVLAHHQVAEMLKAALTKTTMDFAIPKRRQSSGSSKLKGILLVD